jgi:hypothetical protein
MDNLKTSIHILAVADSQEAATSLLTNCFPGVNSSDGQEWTKTEGSFTIKSYIKYPGTDLTRRTPSDFLDIIVATAAIGTDGEQEVLNYISARGDSAIKLWIDESGTNTSAEEKGLLVSVPQNVYSNLLEHIKKIVEFNQSFESLAKNDVVDDKAEFVKSIGYTEDKVNLLAYEKGKITYDVARRLYLAQKDSHYLAVVNFHSGKVFKGIEIAEAYIGKFISSNQTSDSSENNIDCKIGPNEGSSEGIGLGFKFLMGENFKLAKPVLPLVIRDNVATLSVEFAAKSPSSIQAIYDFLSLIYNQFVVGMGFDSNLKEFGASVSFRKGESSVFADVTLGGALGEFINARINSLNIDIFKVGVTDEFVLRTDVNAKDIYEKFSVDAILSKLCKTSLEGSGRFINIKTLLLLFKDIAKSNKKVSKLKEVLLVYFFLRGLLAFEKTGILLNYSPEDLKINIINTLDNINGEGFYSGFSAGIDQQFGEGILPMALGQLEGMKGFATMFGDGPSQINFDKISVELTVPSAEFNLNIFLLFPGLTEFLEKNFFN